ncbi:MAG TPA: RecX family transcriptional regulator [Candidatus Doudnabacteria bacterium]|nr:RecX family transcriptional regulator [Candidatus Doudnabacteria bacterium]
MFKKARALKDPTDYDHGFQYALFLLNLSMRTTSEVKEKMTRRGYIPAVINEVINNLLQEKYLDDKNYAEVFINSMKNYKTWGRFMMKKKMYEKQLPKELIEESLNQHVTITDEIAIAQRYLERQYKEVELGSLSYEGKQKIMKRLLARGFGMDVVIKLVK